MKGNICRRRRIQYFPLKHYFSLFVPDFKRVYTINFFNLHKECEKDSFCVIMKVDFTADAPFSIKEDIDFLFSGYLYVTRVCMTYSTK